MYHANELYHCPNETKAEQHDEDMDGGPPARIKQDASNEGINGNTEGKSEQPFYYHLMKLQEAYDGQARANEKENQNEERADS